MSLSKRAAGIFCALAMLSAGMSWGEAQASVVTFYFSGTVEDAFNTESFFTAGMPVTGSVSYDTSVEDTVNTPLNPYWGLYPGALLEFTMKVGGHHYQRNASDNTIFVEDDPSSSSLEYYSYYPSGASVDGMAPVQMDLYLRSTTDILASDALPTTMPQLSDFDWNRSWSITFDGGNNRRARGYVGGSILAISSTPLDVVAVPEPDAIVMTGMAILLFGLVRSSAGRRRFAWWRLG